MKSYQVLVEASGRPLPKEEHLAWRLAEIASSDAPVDPVAGAMVANRLIDNAGVALAALSTSSVQTALAQARLYPRRGGATLIGEVTGERYDCAWAAWANGVAVRELDLHDNYYGFGVAHPADCIPPLLAVAEHCGRSGKDLTRAVLVAYDIIVALTSAIDLNRAGVDHVAHLGPAVAAGVGSLLRLETEVIFEAINHAAHVSCAPLQARKGQISSWKAAAPAHVGKLAIEAVDRAMRGQTNPVPIYEGVSGLLATLFATPNGCEIKLPLPGEPHLAILETYPKAYAAGYHAQALIDLAFRMRTRITDLEDVQSVVIHTKAYTHNYLGSGANDPAKLDPRSSRETLDHSIMYMFAVALEDGCWHHDASYTPARARRESTVRLWRKVSTIHDPKWSRRFSEPEPLDKDHGGHAVITMKDGTIVEDELDVPHSHPRGARPFARADYVAKFRGMAEGLMTDASIADFLAAVDGLEALNSKGLGRLNLGKVHIRKYPSMRTGLFDFNA